MFYKKISKSFESWGKKAHKLPTNNDALKQSILETVKPVTLENPTRKHFRFRWTMIALVPALALLLFVRYGQTPKSMVAMNSQTYSVSGLGVAGDIGLEKNLSYTGLSQSDSMLDKVVDTIAESLSDPDFSMKQPTYIKSGVDIADTREYLKTTFGFDIRTREIQKIYTRLKTIVRGYDGRIDNATVDKKYASINFVIPKTTYDDFVMEVTDIFGDKFITLHENSTNLLRQKQNIEKKTEYASSTLENLKTERTDNIKKYDEKITSLNKEISRLDNSMYALTAQRKTVSSTDTEALKKIDDQINYLSHVRTENTSELMSAVTQHEKDLDSLDNEIKNNENNLIQLVKQDVNLINNVETVDGTITLRWISLFEIVDLYIPIYKTIITICVLIIIGYLILRRKEKEIELP